jgi:hypothetical protein
MFDVSLQYGIHCTRGSLLPLETEILIQTHKEPHPNLMERLVNISQRKPTTKTQLITSQGVASKLEPRLRKPATKTQLMRKYLTGIHLIQNRTKNMVSTHGGSNMVSTRSE